jgi:predicted small lipoprotein YifL
LLAAIIFSLLCISIPAQDPEPGPKKVPRGYRLLLPDYSELPPATKVVLYEIQLSVIAAAYLDYRAQNLDKTDEIREALEGANTLRETAKRLVRRFRDLPGRRLISGVAKGEPAYLTSGELITHFNGHDLGSIPLKKAIRILGVFVANVKAGSSVHVGFIRNGKQYVLEVAFKSRPRELFAIINVTGLVPGQKDPLYVPPAPKKADKAKKKKATEKPIPKMDRSNPFAWGVRILANPKFRGDPGAWDRAVDVFEELSKRKGSGQDFSRAALRFLEETEWGWRLLYDRVSIDCPFLKGDLLGEIVGRDDSGRLVGHSGERFKYVKQKDGYAVTVGEKDCKAARLAFTRDIRDPVLDLLDAYLKPFDTDKMTGLKAKDHMAAVDRLIPMVPQAESMKSVAGPAVLEMFALAHLSEAAAELGPGHEDIAHLADRLGFKLSSDGKVWGPPRDVVVYELAAVATGDDDEAVSSAAGNRTSEDFLLSYIGMYFHIRARMEAGANLKGLHEELVRWSKRLEGKAREHAASLAEAMRKAALCPRCEKGKIPCPQCDGKGTHDQKCPDCKGTGVVAKRKKREIPCRKCNRTGIRKKDASCRKCGKTKKARCPDCRGTGWLKKFEGGRSMGLVVLEELCPVCAGRRTAFRHATEACAACGGFGLRLIPAGSPGRVLDFRELPANGAPE